MAKHAPAITAVLAMYFLMSCASAPEDEGVIVKDDVIDDYIKVAELKEIDAIRTTDQLHSKILTENYIILSDRRTAYLLVFVRRCRALNEREVTPDIRHERNTVRARFDTYRGCRIRSLYALSAGQEKEILELGNEPGN